MGDGEGRWPGGGSPWTGLSVALGHLDRPAGGCAPATAGAGATDGDCGRFGLSALSVSLSLRPALRVTSRPQSIGGRGQLEFGRGRFRFDFDCGLHRRRSISFCCQAGRASLTGYQNEISPSVCCRAAVGLARRAPATHSAPRSDRGTFFTSISIFASLWSYFTVYNTHDLSHSATRFFTSSP